MDVRRRLVREYIRCRRGKFSKQQMFCMMLNARHVSEESVRLRKLSKLDRRMRRRLTEADKRMLKTAEPTFGDPELLEVMLYLYGPDLKPLSKSSFDTLVDCAAWNSHLPTMRRLLSAGARVTRQTLKLYMVNTHAVIMDVSHGRTEMYEDFVDVLAEVLRRVLSTSPDYDHVDQSTPWDAFHALIGSQIEPDRLEETVQKAVRVYRSLVEDAFKTDPLFV